MANENPFLPWLEEEEDRGREAGYFSFQNQWRTPSQKKWYQSQFANIQSQYMGRLGQMARGGQDPNLKFMDFLGGYDWGQQYQQQTPRERGVDTSRYSPFARWMV